MTLTNEENTIVYNSLKKYLRDLNKLSNQNQNLGELSCVYKPELDNSIKITENLIKLFKPDSVTKQAENNNVGSITSQL